MKYKFDTDQETRKRMQSAPMSMNGTSFSIR